MYRPLIHKISSSYGNSSDSVTFLCNLVGVSCRNEKENQHIFSIEPPATIRSLLLPSTDLFRQGYYWYFSFQMGCSFVEMNVLSNRVHDMV